MPKPKGLPKTGGRKKGSLNKKTHDLFQIFENNNFDVPTQLINILPKLDENRQAEVLLKLMEYLYPKRKAATFSMNSNLGCQTCEELASMDDKTLDRELGLLEDLEA